MAYIEVKHLYKRYHMGENVIEANRDVNFEIEKGELVIILGTSGAGKSTLLNVLGGMDVFDEGEVIIDGTDIAGFNDRKRTDYRRNDIGFVFQFYNLVANLTARENVELAVEIVSDSLDPVKVLTEVGLKERIDNFPAQLSGGEQQRVAVARALAHGPKLIIADEPTGNIDPEMSMDIMQLFEAINKVHITVVVISRVVIQL